MATLEKKLENEVEEVLKILDKHRLKIRLNFKTVFSFFDFSANFIVLIVLYGAVWLFFYIGMLIMMSESPSSEAYISLAVFMLSLLSFCSGVFASNEHIRSGVYLYEVKARDSINEIMYYLYDYKRYKCKVKIDDIEPIEIKNRLYLRIKYH